MIRRSVAFAAVFGSALALAAALAPSLGIASGGPVAFSDLAPADEYFGRLHLSAIVVRHRVFALKDDLHHARQQPDAVANDAQDVQDALNDWARRFPRDPWIPPTAWNLATLYEELPGPDAQKRAVAVLQNIREKYAATAFAGYAQRDLARGVGVRPWPHWALIPRDAAALVQSILALRKLTTGSQAQAIGDLENRYFALSHNGDDGSYTRAAWELAAAYERLPGNDARVHAIRLLALLVDRYPTETYGAWALKDLERGVGER
ncbi:MAG: hypothetical protein ABR508_11575 [Candidatus Baltobacteraceae bacterium]